MSTANRTTQGATSVPLNDDFTRTDRSPQLASFLLEVRAPAGVTPGLGERIKAIMAESGFDVTVTPNQPVIDSVQRQQDSAAASLAEVRGEGRLVGWTKDGTLVEGGKVEAAWGVKRETVDAARERGEIFSVWVRGQHWYPNEALKLERSSAAAITRALGDADPSSKLLFLLHKHGALGGQVPTDAVADGKFEDVLRLATDWART